MPTVLEGDIVSGMPDMRDLPLDVEDNVDDVEYVRIMRQTGIAEGETSVSAFNSSI